MISDWSSSKAVTIGTPTETISTPDTPSGPSSGNTNTSYTYSTGGSTSSLGHSLEYRFDWDDGSYSDWSSSTSASNSWSSAGTYYVKAQARCASHTSVMSGWSGSKDVTITVIVSPPVVSNPDPSDGATVAAGASGQLLRVTAPGATSGTFYYDDDSAISYSAAATVSGDYLEVTIPYVSGEMTDNGTNYWYVEATNSVGTTRYPSSGSLQFTVGGGLVITDIAIVNPDYYRIVKFGNLRGECSNPKYYSIAYATHDDADPFDPNTWHGVGAQSDFIGTVLSEAGYSVDYFTQDGFTAADISIYDLVIVQDPLESNFKAFDKSVETTLPDLLEKTTSQSFNDKLRNYFNDGGKIILVGDAVRLLENAATPGRYTLDFGKTINADEVSNTQSNPSSCVPAKWLFIRGNPFCGRDRTGSGAYTVESSSLLSAGAKLSDLSFFDGNDLPHALTWSNTVYYPSDGVSLLDIRVQGTGEYVLIGSTCSPPEYTVTVDDVLSHFMGYTEYNGKKIFYIGSDTYFDYDFINYQGTWHAGQYLEMKHIITDQGKQAIVKLVEHMGN